MKTKIAITGGHPAPALAVIPTLKEKYELIFLGRKFAYEGDKTGSFEYKAVRDLNIPFISITTGRLQRKFTRYTLLSLLKLPIGFLQSLYYLITQRPKLILSFGGYIAVPVCIVGKMLGIKIITHEQTISPGLANKIIEKLAWKICLTFEDSNHEFPKEKTIVTGNPIREELFSPPKESPFSFSKNCYKNDQLLPLIFITGGSGGAHFINTQIISLLENLLEKYIIIHQTGNPAFYNDWEKANAKKKTLPEKLQDRYFVQQTISTSELAWIYKNTSLLIGRAGANTTIEITTFHIPSILIPLTISSGNEQQKHARLVEEKGLGKVLIQEKTSPHDLEEEISSMIEKYSTVKREAPEPFHQDAVKKIINVVEAALNGS